MSDNAKSPNDDDNAETRFTRWVAWIVIAASGIFFLVYTAVYH